MFAIVVNEKGGEQKRLEFDKPEVTIGRVQGNDIILPKGNVSKRHSRIVLKDGKFIIVDLKSTNGTYVNGRKITSPLVIKSTDKIYIGDFILAVEDAEGASVTAGASPAASASASAPMPKAAPVAEEEDEEEDDDLPSAPQPSAAPPPAAKAPEPRASAAPSAQGRTLPPPVRSPAPAREVREAEASGPVAAAPARK